jgi:hypothetical protein
LIIIIIYTGVCAKLGLNAVFVGCVCALTAWMSCKGPFCACVEAIHVGWLH